jgi:hypothetical protein
MEQEQQEIGAVRAKMQCQSSETTDWGPNCAKQVKVNLGAVYGTEGENKDFTDATPSGSCWMVIKENFPASRFFKPGKKYYVTFTEAPDK